MRGVHRPKKGSGKPGSPPNMGSAVRNPKQKINFAGDLLVRDVSCEGGAYGPPTVTAKLNAVRNDFGIEINSIEITSHKAEDYEILRKALLGMTKFKFAMEIF